MAGPVIKEVGRGRVHVALRTTARKDAGDAGPSVRRRVTLFGVNGVTHAIRVAPPVCDAEVAAAAALDTKRRRQYLHRKGESAAAGRRAVDAYSSRTAGRFGVANNRPPPRPPAPKPFVVNHAVPAPAQFVTNWPPPADVGAGWWTAGYESGLFGSEKHRDTRAPRRVVDPKGGCML